MIGIKSIDIEHKHLVDFVNMVERSGIESHARLMDSKLISSIRTLFHNHFIKEEDLMFRIKYPELNSHMMEHSKMLTDLDVLISNFNITGQAAPVTVFISDWIVDHMKTMDFPIAQFIKAATAMRQKAATTNQSSTKSPIQKRPNS